MADIFKLDLEEKIMELVKPLKLLIYRRYSIVFIVQVDP